MRKSVIIAKLSGAQVERTSVFAGMSGSPVYIDGKLVGAIAYAFPFAKEPIAGITPIKQMVEMFEQGLFVKAIFTTLFGMLVYQLLAIFLREEPIDATRRAPSW